MTLRFNSDLYLFFGLLGLATAGLLGYLVWFLRENKKSHHNEWFANNAVALGVMALFLFFGYCSLVSGAEMEAETQSEYRQLHATYSTISINHVYNTPHRDIDFTDAKGAQCFGDLKMVDKQLKIFNVDCKEPTPEYHESK